MTLCCCRSLENSCGNHEVAENLDTFSIFNAGETKEAKRQKEADAQKSLDQEKKKF
jgi:hypothetical protein